MWGAMRHLAMPHFRVIVGGSLLLSSGAASLTPSSCAPARRVPPAQDQDDTLTRFQLITGDPDTKVEDHLALPQSSPIVASWAFMDWKLDAGPPALASAPRSKVVGALLHATRRPTLLEQSRLEELFLIDTEVLSDEATRWAQALATTEAFTPIYSQFGEWKAKANTFVPLLANPELMVIREDSFTSIEPWDPQAGPTVLSFLSRTSIADLIHADGDLSDEAFVPHCLARAFILLGSKDNQTERDDESSTVRLASEQITGILKRELRSESPSAAGLAQKFVSLLHDVQLPETFCMHALTPRRALREFELGYTYARAGALEAASIEAELFLNVGRQYPVFRSLLARFSSGPAAASEFNRLTSQLLPATLASSTNLVKLPALASLFERASWTETIMHLVNSAPNDSGSSLITALISSQVDILGDVDGSGGAATGAAALAGVSEEGSASYGSIREQSIGDALRMQSSIDALADAAMQSGAQRVETLMLSGSVLLTRAQFLQESWLHNKHPTIAFCSLDRPYICPFFANVLTEDKVTGVCPARLQSYVFPPAELAILRTKRWSSLDIIAQALELRRLNFGTAYAPVKPSEVYVVESSLRAVREVGSRLFYALNLAFSPASGLSFTDGVDKQIEAVDFATSLPKAECAEWLTFLNAQFRTNWLDAGGEHYHSKLKTGRPDAPEAQLSEFLPMANAYYSNVDARMTRAQPVAEFRVAFPSLFSSDIVSLPGTSSSGGLGRGGGGGGLHGGGKDKVDPVDPKKGNKKGKGKAKHSDDAASGPGSKASLAKPLSDSELWFAGVVVKIDEVAKHLKISKPSDKCWPVVLTKKKGNDALEVCPDHASHGNLNQPVHQRPKGLDLNYIYKNFTRAATSSENKSADWQTLKKKKN